MTVRIQTGDKEPIVVMATDSLGGEVTGLTNLKIRMRRASDDYFYDWADDTFKASGSVSQLLESLAEINATAAPGEYHLDTVTHVGGFDTSVITNASDDDNYFFTAIQDGSPQSAANFPLTGEIKVGQWVDQVFDFLDEKRSYHVKQAYAYDRQNDRLYGNIWVELGNVVLSGASLQSCTVKWYNKSGALQFTMTDATPDAQGFFKVERLTPGLSSGDLDYALAEISIDSADFTGTVSAGKGNFVF